MSIDYYYMPRDPHHGRTPAPMISFECPECNVEHITGPMMHISGPEHVRGGIGGMRLKRYWYLVESTDEPGVISGYTSRLLPALRDPNPMRSDLYVTSTGVEDTYMPMHEIWAAATVYEETHRLIPSPEGWRTAAQMWAPEFDTNEARATGWAS